jgi:hypothetical protein
MKRNLHLVLGVTALLINSDIYCQGRFINKGDGQPALEIKTVGAVEGNPYWEETFAEGETKSRQNGKWIRYPKARFDAYKNEFEYEAELTKKVFRIDASQITDFKLNGILFRCDFPPIGEWDKHHFYQVLYDGNTKLLKRIYTKILTPTDFGSVTKPSKFVQEEQLFLLKNGEMKRIKGKKSKVLEVLNEKESAVSDFVKSKSLDYSSEGDLQKIVAFYDRGQAQ